MAKFFAGFLVGILALIVAGFFYVRLGFIDPRADIPINTIENRIAMPSLDAAVDRRAPKLQNPVSPTNANLFAGMKIYQENCSSCHGDINRPHAMFADVLYPRAPQFMKEASEMPENQNFYIIQHGVRMSGMPGWRHLLTSEQMWQVTTFLSHMDKLPLQISEAWKAAATTSAESGTSSQ